MKNTGIFIIFIALASTISINISHCGDSKVDSNLYLNLSDTVNYVGIDKCRTCHEDKYETFIETGMGKSFSLASLEKSKANFKNPKPVFDPKLNLYYQPYSIGKDIWIHEYRLSEKDTIHNRREKISHIIGSGHHTNSHFWSDNGYLFQAPLTYYTQLEKWDLPPGFEEYNSRFSRKIDIECMSCHNAMPSTAFTDENGTYNTVNKFSKLPAGIDCERCHGPGELHVFEKSKGVVVDTKKEIDRTIVNPSKLPWKKQVDVCQRCHLQGNNVLKPGKEFTDFRPGMNLEDVFVVYNPGSQQGDELFMAGHADRFQQSKCFIKSNTSNNTVENLKFTCITCHDPHVSVKKTNTEKFNLVCKNCHQTTDNSCTESTVKLHNKNNNCVSCHMPANNTQDIPHVTVHDHYIRKPGKLEKSKLNSKELYAVNSQQKNAQIELQAYISWYEKFEPESYYLLHAEKLAKANRPDGETLIHLYYSKQDMKSILPLIGKINSKTATPWTCYRVAKAFEFDNKGNESLQWMEYCVEKDPYNIDFGNEYASLLIQNQKPEEAMGVIQKLLSQQSKNEKTILLAGICSLNLKDYTKAIQFLRKAILLNPDNKDAFEYLAILYSKIGDEQSSANARLQASKLR